jgi:hypothetical protein
MKLFSKSVAILAAASQFSAGAAELNSGNAAADPQYNTLTRCAAWIVADKSGSPQEESLYKKFSDAAIIRQPNEFINDLNREVQKLKRFSANSPKFAEESKRMDMMACMMILPK